MSRVTQQANEELINVALGQKASQSSYSKYSKPDDPSRAVNGVKNGKFSFCTEIEDKPWWMVDLGDSYKIRSIKIFNREDCASERAKGLTVQLSSDSQEWKTIAEINYLFGGYISGSPLVLEFPRKYQPTTRFVKLQLLGKNYLHLDEVEIFTVNAEYARKKSNQDFSIAIKKSRGIVHIGASKGQEAEFYARHNKPVIWIEALPEIYKMLEKKVYQYPNQQAINALVTDNDGEEYKFNVSNNKDAVSSSLLEFGDDVSQIYPGLKMIDSVSLVSKTLNMIYREFEIDGSLFDFLVLDVQGAELLVLKGAESVLQNFEYVWTEVSMVNIYKNGVLWDELKTFLNQKGFQETISCTPAKHGNVLFTKERYQNFGTARFSSIPNPKIEDHIKLEKTSILDTTTPKQFDSLESFNSINYQGQLFQDKWVIMMTKGKQKGAFLEIGSTDGVHLNNTFCLEKTFSWSGICVEPNPDFYKKLCLNRTAVTLPYAFYKESAKIVEFINHGVIGTINEFASTDKHSSRREDFRAKHGTIKVITMRAEEILSLYNFPERFDFLSLDVEGAELDILESFNLSKWLPALACVEHNFVSDRRAAIFDLLSRHGYQRMQCRFDDWYYNLDILQAINPEIPLTHYQQILEYFCQHHNCKITESDKFSSSEKYGTSMEDFFKKKC